MWCYFESSYKGVRVIQGAIRFYLVTIFFVLVGIFGFVLFSEHPISVGFWFILYSAYASVFIGLEWSRYFGYLLFFVYVGALLVIFCMVVSLTPNPVFRVVPFLGLLPFLGSGQLGETNNVIGKTRNNIEISGDLFLGLGTYDGVGWGRVLVWIGLVLLLRVIAVASMCKRSAGPLVRFRYKQKNVV